jgi:peptide/nickel transport system substrate-binding protein
MKRSIWLAVPAAFATVIAGFGSTYTATATTEPAGEAGAGGHLLLLQWQAPSIVNPYLSSGTKDNLAGSLVLEPLASFAPETAELVPRLVDEIPTLENGEFAEDLMSITWTLKEGLMWSDGTPVTADDAVFTWEYCTTAETGCTSADNFSGISEVVAVDEQTIRIDFEEPTPNPYSAFISYESPIIQQAQFADCVGAAASTCAEANQFPIGTGPYVVADFRAEDTVLYEVNPNYRDLAAGKPSFGTVEVKGGGDAAAAARTVLEEGAADYGWNLQVSPEVLTQMEAAGIGRVEVGFAANVEHINLNQANNRNEEAQSEYLDGENPHPLFHDNPDLARAMSMAINRDELVAIGYGDTGAPACNVWMAPPAVSEANDWCLTQDIEGANALLDEAGIVDTNDDGIREVDGEELVLDYYTSTNPVRQDFQALIQEYWAEIGIEANMRNADSGIFFGPSTNPDSFLRFYADIQMYTFVPLPDPQAHFSEYTLASMTGEANGWGGNNVPRYYNEEFEATFAELAQTADPDERSALTIELNDIMINDGVIIPLVHRASVSAFANEIQGVGTLNGWDSEYWNIADWYREG